MKLSDIRLAAGGGIAAALVALPMELMYGAIAVSPLGAVHAVNGMKAALWSCVLSGFLSFLFRATPGMISGTRAAVAFTLAALTAAVLVDPRVARVADPTEMVLVLLFICASVAGLIQLIFGVVRLGSVLKFIPYPVTAGLMTGVAILMAKSSIKPGFGVADGVPWRDFFGTWHPLSVAVTTCTLLLCFRPLPIFRKIPFIVPALIAGTLLHHLLSMVAGGANLGGTLGSIDGLFAQYSIWHQLQGGELTMIWGWLPLLFPYALVIATLISLESLLCLSLVEATTHQRTDADQQLRVEGLNNLAAGLTGGFPIGGVLPRVSANLGAGGRGHLSGLICSVTIACIVLFGSRWISLIPHAVTAAIILFFACKMIDDGTQRLVRQLLSQYREIPKVEYRLLLTNFGVILSVAMVAVFGGMLPATGAGVIAAILLFVINNIKPIIRKTSCADQHRSLKVRASDAITLLEREGGEIVMFEMEGVLFFGTAERLAQEASKLPQRTKSLILNFRNVRDVDATGGRTLVQLARNLKACGRTLILCGVNPSVSTVLLASGLNELVPPGCWFHDEDQALEAQEDALLERMGFRQTDVTLGLDQTMLAQGFSKDEVTILESYLTKCCFSEKGAVFRQGDSGDSLFVSANGIVDICLPLQDGTYKRVACFAPGVIFGEMALIEGKPRSADANVSAHTWVWELSRGTLDEISQKHPAIAQKVLLNLGRSLSERLRITTHSFRLASE